MNPTLLEQIRVLEEQVHKLRILAESQEKSDGKTSGRLRDLEGIWKDYGPFDESEIDAVLYRLPEDGV